MKRQKWLSLITITGIVLVAGCSTQERVRTYEVSEMTNDTVENRVVEEYVGPNHKKVINKQVIREKIRCIGPNGKIIPVNTVTACMKHNGKIVDEVFQEEKSFRSK